ncbi:MAG: TonB family protein [Saprospiraceae bacterium]
MINYILEVSFCWSIFYLAYYFLFGKETFFHVNRGYLLTTLIVGLLLPVFDFSLPNFGAEEELSLGEYLTPITTGLTSVEEVVGVTITASALEPGLNLWTVLQWVYWLGVIFFSLRFLIGVSQIVREYRQAKIESKGSYQLVRTQTIHLPFSFFSCLFWSDQVDYNEVDKAKILDHELAHIRQGHSFDVVLLEILSIFLWCSPLIHLYNNELRNLHEYLADAAVLATTKTKQYGQLLLRQSQSGMQLAVANNFIHSQLKKRIKMMTKNKSSKLAYLKYSLSIPLLVLLMSVFAQKISIAQSLSELNEKPEAVVEVPTEIDGDPIYKVVHEMPRFPGCEEEESLALKKKCATQKMLMFIYSNIRYPKEARQLNIEGTCVVRFVVGEQGKILEPQLVRTLGGGIGEECLRVVNLMNEQHKRWTPGKLENGKAVKVYFNLPVKFQLESSGPTKKEEKEELATEDEVIFKVVEEMPKFPGCEAIEGDQAKQDCANKKMLEFIYANVKYPEEALKKGVEGVNVVRFIVDETGNITEPTVVRDIGSGTGEEVIRIVKLMQALPEKWTPGRQKGKAVKVYFNLPVKFKLDGGVKKQNENVAAATTPIVAKEKNVFKSVQEMPRFPGSEKVKNKQQRELAAQKKLLEFVYKNLTYPAAAKEEGVEGTVVVNFTVDKNGTIINPKILRKIGSGCEEAVLAMIDKMPTWIPGKKDGKAVNVAYNLPVKFKLPAQEELVTIVAIGNEATKDKKVATLALEDFKTFPNPSRGKINLQFKGAATPTTLQIVDATGKSIFEESLTRFEGVYQKEIDLSKAAKGTYNIVISQGAKAFVKSIVLQ